MDEHVAYIKAEHGFLQPQNLLFPKTAFPMEIRQMDWCPTLNIQPVCD